MTEQEKFTLYLNKLKCYFEDVPKVLKHLEDVVKQDDGEIKDPNLLGVKAMCSSLYLCLFYINQISIVADQKSLLELSNIIKEVYLKYKPMIEKINSAMGHHSIEEFEEKGLNFVVGNTTLQ